MRRHVRVGETKTKTESMAERFKGWRKRILLTSIITYSTFYLCRVNMSVAMPGIMEEFALSKTEMGFVLTALFMAYAAGQFINGQLGDKFGARKLVLVGIVGSAILNLVFGFSNGLLMMVLIWGLNGYFQSMGWSPTVKTIANWFPTKLRGKAGGLLGTSYQIGNAYSWALAGLVVGIMGWRWAFFVPAIIFLVSGVHWFVRIRNAPEEVGLPTIEEESKGIEKSEVRKDHHLGFKFTIASVLKSRGIWIAGMSLFFLNIVRYGFISWAPTFMFEVQNATISVAAFKAITIPLAGCFGAVFAGYISDRFFKCRRAPIAVIMLLILGLAALLYPTIPVDQWELSLLTLMIIGFMTFGPHVAIVGIIPMDFGTRKAAASAAGFIDGMGYIGAAITGIGSGLLIDSHGWDAAFYFWVFSALAAAILMATLWHHKPKQREYH